MNADWWEIWTIEEAEEQLKGFKFKGPGLYLTKTDTTLVVPEGVKIDKKIWKQKTNYYRFYVWNSPYDQTLLSVLSFAPTVSGEVT